MKKNLPTCHDSSMASEQREQREAKVEKSAATLLKYVIQALSELLRSCVIEYGQHLKK